MIADLLKCEIVIIPHTSADEIEYLIKREEISYLARTRLLNGEISFADYLDFMELAGIDIDEHLTTANDNCRIAGF